LLRSPQYAALLHLIAVPLFMTNSTPAWFTQAVSTPFSTHTVTVEGCDIVYQQWNRDVDKPGLMLIHGNGAHAGWWNFIAPAFIDRFNVAALNLGGMGDSGHRQRYTPDLFVKEVMATCDAVGFEQPLLLGHSFGGRLAFYTMRSNANKIPAVIMADSPFHNQHHLKRIHSRRSEAKPNKVYTDFDEALSRFRLSPAQPCDNAYIMDYIGRRSLQEVEGGWTWKFDPRVWAEFDYLGFLSLLPEPGDKILAMIYGEDSVLFTEGNLDYNKQLFKDLNLPDMICIKHAYHHLLLDQPLEFIDVCNRLLNSYLEHRL